MGVIAVGRESRVAVADGRVLQVLERGHPDGKPVLAHNGTPNSRLMYEPAVRLAESQGIRLISYDRPGYGGSTPQPGRTVSDCEQDVRAIAAALGLERVAVWGISAAVRTRSRARRCCPTSSRLSGSSPRSRPGERTGLTTSQGWASSTSRTRGCSSTIEPRPVPSASRIGSNSWGSPRSNCTRR